MNKVTGGLEGGRKSVTAALIRSARRRWAMLGLGLALLALLFIFAGVIRTPGARKNPYTVIASRALAVVGAVLLARILLVTNDDGVPVFLIDCGAGSEPPGSALDLVEGRCEVVPLPDVVAFIRDQRYVPPRGAAVVLGIDGRAGLVAAAEAMGADGRVGRLPATFLLGEAAVEELAGGAMGGGAAGLPAEVSLAVSVAGGGEKAAVEAIKAAADRALKAAGRAAEYALVEDESGMDPGSVTRATGMEALFGGGGLNRYGDRGNRIRLVRISEAAAGGRWRGMRLRTYTAVYRGNYAAYPLWAWLSRTAAGPERRG